MDGKMKRSDGKEYEITMDSNYIDYGYLRGGTSFIVEVDSKGKPSVEISFPKGYIQFFCLYEKKVRIVKTDCLESVDYKESEGMSYIYLIFQNSEVALSYNTAAKQISKIFEEHTKILMEKLSLPNVFDLWK